MLLNGAVLVEFAVQPGMGTDPAPIIEYLHGGSGQTHIHLLADILKGNRVVHPLHGDMVVGANGCLFPGGKLEWILRQRPQKRLFLREETGSAAVFLLEGLVVERFKTLPNCFIQLQQGQELPIPQSCKDEGGDDPYGSFHSRFILWRSDSGGNNGSGIMLSQLLVGFVQNHLIFSVLFHAGFQVVTLNHPRDTAKIPVGVDMGGSPALLIHGEEGLHIAVATIRQGRNEHISRDDFAGIRVNNGSGITCPVHLHDLSGLVVQVHGGIGLVEIVAVVLIELGRLVRNFAGRFALVAVFQPQQIQRHTAFLHFPVHIGVIRHLVRRFARSAGKKPFCQLPVGHFIRQRPLQAAVVCTLKRCGHGVAGAVQAGRNLGFVEPKAVKPEDLTVIGHNG